MTTWRVSLLSPDRKALCCVFSRSFPSNRCNSFSNPPIKRSAVNKTLFHRRLVQCTNNNENEPHMSTEPVMSTTVSQIFKKAKIVFKFTASTKTQVCELEKLAAERGAKICKGYGAKSTILVIYPEGANAKQWPDKANVLHLKEAWVKNCIDGNLWIDYDKEPSYVFIPP